VCLCVFDTLESLAEPIEMMFGIWNRVGPRNHALGGGPYPPKEGALWGFAPH